VYEFYRRRDKFKGRNKIKYLISNFNKDVTLSIFEYIIIELFLFAMKNF
jgi:hypothetical protein